MKFIQPKLRPLIVNGRVIYKEQSRAFSIIRFKRRLLDYFPELKKDQGWSYQIECWLNHDKTKARLEQIKQRGEGIPLLLFIYPTK